MLVDTVAIPVPRDMQRQGEYVAVVNLQGPDKPAPPAAHGPAKPKPSRPDKEIDLTVHSRTAYHIAIVAVACYFVNLILEDIKSDGSVTILRWELLRPSFDPGALLHLSALWLLVNSFLLASNLGVRCWRAGRDLYVKTAVWDTLWLLAALVLHAAMVVVPTAAMHLLDLPMSARGALTCEQVRLIMKSISYVREHVRTALTCPPRPGARVDLSVAHLAYFMFAPTLVYRDTYERSPRVRPLALLRHGSVFLASLFTMVVVSARSSLRPLCGEDAPLLAMWTALGAPRLLFVVVRLLPMGAVLLAGMTVALHHWHRFFAELLRFRMRSFTRAWWNGKGYEDYFRDWNQFVKAWLYKYVFKEMRAFGYSIFWAKFLTIIVSAVWHEYILVNTLRYLIPYFFLLYIFCSAIVLTEPFGLQKGNRGNFFLVATSPFGVAFIVAFYFIETFARLQCPDVNERPWDFFVPRQWLCDDPFRNCTFI